MGNADVDMGIENRLQENPLAEDDVYSSDNRNNVQYTASWPNELSETRCFVFVVSHIVNWIFVVFSTVTDDRYYKDFRNLLFRCV